MSVNLKFSVAEILSRAAQLAENLDRADGQKDGSIFASEWNKFARKNKLPKIDRNKCIRCFCCQEFCPKGAMIVHKNGLVKLLTKERGKNEN